MPARTLPGLGLTGFWDEGADGWKPGMDTNLQRLSVLVQAGAISQTTELPASPSAGDIYIVPSDAASNANDIALYDGPSGSEAWVYITPAEGWTVYVQDTSTEMRFDGSAWQEIASGGSMTGAEIVSAIDTELGSTAWRTAGSGSDTTVTEKTADYSVADADLAGSQYHEANHATAMTITVPAGLTGTEPLVIERTGAGTVTFAAASGVTINSRDGNLAIGGQYGAVTLVPKGSDTYTLIGDLVA